MHTVEVDIEINPAHYGGDTPQCSDAIDAKVLDQTKHRFGPLRAEDVFVLSSERQRDGTYQFKLGCTMPDISGLFAL